MRRKSLKKVYPFIRQLRETLDTVWDDVREIVGKEGTWDIGRAYDVICAGGGISYFGMYHLQKKYTLEELEDVIQYIRNRFIPLLFQKLQKENREEEINKIRQCLEKITDKTPKREK